MYWDCLGTFQITGKKDRERSMNRVWSKSIPTWKSKFYELNQENYDRENASRWGNGGFYRRRSRPERNSDTEDNCEDEDGEDEYGEGQGW